MRLTQRSGGLFGGCGLRPTDLVELLLKGELVQLVEREVHENSDALVEHAHAVVEGKCLLGVIALRPGRVRQAPMRRHRLPGPDRADFVGRIVARSEYKIELRRAERRKLIPGLRAES